MELDPNIRKVVVDKRGYLHCSKCGYKVGAEYEPNKGYEHGWIGVLCCAYPCGVGMGDNIPLGHGVDFDPSLLWTQPKPTKVVIEVESEVDSKGETLSGK